MRRKIKQGKRKICLERYIPLKNACNHFLATWAFMDQVACFLNWTPIYDWHVIQ